MHSKANTSYAGACTASTAPEIACQQVLEHDGSVFSVQWLVLPHCCRQFPSAPQLLERYLEFIRRFTCTLIRPVFSAEGIEFRLLVPSLALLAFAPPQHVRHGERDEVQLPIRGGVLVQAGGRDSGVFSLIAERDEDGCKVTMQLSGFFPLLLGSRTPSKLYRLLYRFTQAYIHKVVTVRFLSRLHSDLTGVALPPRVKDVTVREGIRT